MITNYVKEPHTAIFTGPTSCGKTQKVLNLVENRILVGFALYLYQGKKSIPAAHPLESSNGDIFRMN